MTDSEFTYQNVVDDEIDYLNPLCGDVGNLCGIQALAASNLEQQGTAES